MGYSLSGSAANSWGRAGEKAPRIRRPLSQEKGKEVGMQIKMKLASESHVPRFRAGVGTWRSGYMIPIRLPWRHRARPSATLHEIPSAPKSKLILIDATQENRVRQDRPERVNPSEGYECKSRNIAISLISGSDIENLDPRSSCPRLRGTRYKWQGSAEICR